MFPELETVVLTVDIDRSNLKAGDIGTVVHVQDDGQSYEVEFVTLAGDTVAIETVKSSQIRRVHEGEIARARMVAE